MKIAITGASGPFGAGVTRCACGEDSCGEQLISIDVLTGEQRARHAAV